jgi:hypothetical protein
VYIIVLLKHEDMREENLSVYHCFIESTRTHTCMREENLSVYHYFIEALGHVHV